MSRHPHMNPIDRPGFANFEVVLFDLDGVITKTAVLHAAAWKRLFDEYLKKLATRTGSPYEPFDPSRDYQLYVDGKSRYEGVKDFLNVPSCDPSIRFPRRWPGS